MTSTRFIRRTFMQRSMVGGLQAYRKKDSRDFALCSLAIPTAYWARSGHANGASLASACISMESQRNFAPNWTTWASACPIGSGHGIQYGSYDPATRTWTAEENLVRGLASGSRGRS